MNIGEIIGDALVYPFHNIKALLIYVILGIIGALIGGAAVVSMACAFSTTGLGGAAFTGLSIVGILVFILIMFLIGGYTLDIIKYGIERRDDGPGIDFGRQVANAIKLIIVDIVYFIIPVIITFVLGLFLKDWIMLLITLILFIIFALANFIGKCRLAKSDSLGDAIAMGETIGDISRVGLGRLIGTVIVVLIILLVISFIIGLISGLNATVGNILLGIFSVYFLFFYNRAIGLLYSNAA